jgi:tight adherence protein B
MMWLAGAALFAGLFVLCYAGFGTRRVSKSRLGIEKQPRDVNRSVSNILGEERSRRMAQALNLAGLSTPPGTFVVRIMLVSVVAAVLGALISPLLSLLCLVLPTIVARSWVKYKVTTRRNRFAEQLSDTLQLLTASMRSGFGLSQALTMITDDVEEPTKSEIEQVLAATRVGFDLSDALRTMAQRMDSNDLDWVVSAIDINREAGGNLSEVLENLNATIRDRHRIQRKIRTYTAEGRLSAQILLVLPLGFLLLEWAVNPDGISSLFSGAGLTALVMAAALMGVGWLWIRKIISVKF